MFYIHLLLFSHYSLFSLSCVMYKPQDSLIDWDRLQIKTASYKSLPHCTPCDLKQAQNRTAGWPNSLACAAPDCPSALDTDWRTMRVYHFFPLETEKRNQFLYLGGKKPTLCQTLLELLAPRQLRSFDRTSFHRGYHFCLRRSVPLGCENFHLFWILH